ncbi:hypothetical protein J1TS1_39120 [Shouchella clausii]|uniref:hypothetical protein n=1 Tax=Shouchella TaxID=2893057 RepID=UPI000BA66C31|nr:hypothetical protein [Shouchella clausii]MCM3311043.1 hypothetical protein [Psychrobacillus sp. MER TA 17]MCM3311044.1 hypothetical protein [Psychrobacillus sp. MER TA 17]MCZ1182568.1 hypothetical protein [Shouchella clausii]PAE81137.1 hypothetical protein CHH77_14620 [Shouchella clausii]GIN09767.1 hypothetical protein J1TS1_39120 [Shouchella clausii]
MESKEIKVKNHWGKLTVCLLIAIAITLPVQIWVDSGWKMAYFLPVFMAAWGIFYIWAGKEENKK